MLEISIKKIHYYILIIDTSRLGSWFKHGFQIWANPLIFFCIWWVNKLVHHLQSTPFFSAAQHFVSWVVIYKYHCVGVRKKNSPQKCTDLHNGWSVQPSAKSIRWPWLWNLSLPTNRRPHSTKRKPKIVHSGALCVCVYILFPPQRSVHRGSFPI